MITSAAKNSYVNKFGSYALGKRIHEGMRHDVCRGTAPDGQSVILKILNQLHPSPDKVTRFRHEHDIQASINSERVAAVRGFETDQRRWALVLDDFGGEALSHHISDGLDLRERLRIAIATAQGVNALHDRNIIHKDINPSNIVRNPTTGDVKLIDFGIATALWSESPAFTNGNRLE